MIKVEKDFDDIPSILTQQVREDAFEANIVSSSYIDSKNRYKVKSVQEKLKEIYHRKCAYCEKKLLDSPKHIEHYRPKSTYYWLAYSWDNLLLSCGECNGAKGKDFDTQNGQIAYSGETFDVIHHLGISYDDAEKPKLINPEREDVLSLITFDVSGAMDSDDERVHYTIHNACKLNRDELVERRVQVIEDFINIMRDHYFYFIKKKEPEIFHPIVKDFIDKCKKENEFFALRHYMVHHSKEFFEEGSTLQKIVSKLFESYKQL